MKKPIIQLILLIITFFLYVVAIITCNKCESIPDSVKIIMTIFISIAAFIEEIVITKTI